MKKIIIAFLVFLTFNSNAQFSGGGTTSTTVPEYGEAVVANAGVTVTTTVTDIISFTLPSAGIWDVEYSFSVRTGTPNHTGAFWVSDNVNGIVPNSAAEFQVPTAIPGTTALGTYNQKVRITTTGSTIYKVRGQSNAQNMIVVGFPAAIITTTNCSKVLWKKIAGFLPSTGQSIDYADLTVASQTFAGASAIIHTRNEGNLTTDGTLVTLLAGKTYRLISNLSMSNYGGATATFPKADFSWQTSAGVNLGRIGTLVAINLQAAPSNQVANSVIRQAEYIFTPNTNTQIRLGVTGVTLNGAVTTVTISGGAFIQQLGSSAVGTTPVNDQAASGYIDIGNVRMQWGRTTNGFNGARTIALPAAFANTNYTVTATAFSTGSSTQLSRTIFLGDYTTSTFIGRCVTGNDSSSGVDWNWTAFGQKP